MAMQFNERIIDACLLLLLHDPVLVKFVKACFFLYIIFHLYIKQYFIMEHN